MKIDLDWIKKELDAGRKVELEYLGGISNYGHAGEYARFLESAGTVTVDGIENGCLNIKNTWYVIDDEYLKHFRIKRTSNYDPIEGEGTLPSLNLQGKGTPIYSEINFPDSDPDLSDKPTFDDLIDVAVQAQKDGLLYSVKLLPDGIEYQLRFDTFNVSIFEDVVNNIQREIDFINSLYTETFVIESEEDIDRVNADAVIVLSNGSELTEIVTKRKDSIEFSSLGVLYFYILKGATVTQKRGQL